MVKAQTIFKNLNLGKFVRDLSLVPENIYSIIKVIKQDNITNISILF